MDLPPQVSMCRDMDEQSDTDIRALFTQIGCIMEDASVVALIWEAVEALTAEDRLEQLTLAHHQIGEVLHTIRSIVEPS